MRKTKMLLIALTVSCFLIGIAGVAFAADAQASADSRININTASVDQLSTLKGIGPALAQRIVDYRETNGEFSSVDDLINVRGIGEKTLANIRDSIVASPTKPNK